MKLLTININYADNSGTYIDFVYPDDTWEYKHWWNPKEFEDPVVHVDYTRAMQISSTFYKTLIVFEY